MDIRHSCGMPRALNDLSECIVPKRIPEQHRNISHCTVMIRIMKPCRITEMCTIHSNPLCLLIHQLHKSIPGTAYSIRQCDTTLRTGWQHGTIKKVDGPHGLTGLKACLGGILLIKPLEHFLGQSDLLIQIIQVLNSHEYRHDLRHGSRIDLLIALHISDDLSAFYLHQHCVGTVDTAHLKLTDNRSLQRLHPATYPFVPADDHYKCQDHDSLYHQAEYHFYFIYLFFYFLRFTLF